jgi:hypothetical protein
MVRCCFDGLKRSKQFYIILPKYDFLCVKSIILAFVHVYASKNQLFYYYIYLCMQKESNIHIFVGNKSSVHIYDIINLSIQLGSLTID